MKRANNKSLECRTIKCSLADLFQFGLQNIAGWISIHFFTTRNRAKDEKKMKKLRNF